MTLDDLSKALSLGRVASLCYTTTQTVKKWITVGVEVSRRRVKLVAVRVGDRYLVLPAALEKFIADCNPDGTQIPETPDQIRRRCLADKERLAAMLGDSKPRRKPSRETPPAE